MQEEIPEETREKEEILDEETEEDNISNNIKEKGFYKTMNLDVKFEANLDDFIEEISPEYTLEPSLQKILNRHMEEFSIPSVEDIIYTSAEIIFSSFMEDFIDDFDTINMTEDYKIDDSLYTKFSNMINKTDRETIEELKNRAREFRMGTKISAETEIIADLTLPPVVPEIKEVKVSEKSEEIEIKTPTSETDIPGIIYESLSEEFVEDFIKGELKPYDEEEAMGIGLGIEMEEEEELEEEETITREETLEKETELSEMETREIEVKESDLEKIEERLEKILAEEAKEVKTETAKEVKTETAEEVKTETAEEVKTETAEEVKTEKTPPSPGTEVETMPDIDKEIIKCKATLKKNINKIDDIIKKYEKLYKECPSYPPLCYAIGSSYIKKGLFIEGVKEFMKTIDIKAFDGKDNFLKNLNG